jgi:transposase-like protein
MSKTDETARPKLSARVKQRIVKLHDQPCTPAEIARELNISESVVRHVLAETCPLDTIYA